MKKMVAFITVLIFSIIPVFGQPYYGNPLDKPKADSGKPEFVWYASFGQHGLAMGILGYISHIGIGAEMGGPWGSQEGTPSFQDYDIPHYDYTLETFKENAYHLVITGNYLITHSFAMGIGFGFYDQTEKVLARSNATGWYYKYGGNTTVGAVYQISAQLYPWQHLLLGIGYSSYIGLNGHIGFML